MELELLAPARNAEQGILALRSGADAVYMGGPSFGARQGAINGLAEIEAVVKEARLWNAKVFITLNTLLFDHELELARHLAWQVYEAGADALILQDLGLLTVDLPPIARHASTQAVCDSPGKVAFLASAGFTRAVLARELSLEEMAAIKGAADIELEAFIYGALCVGESGQCYLSGSICGRSGNRGECAQPCRAGWDLQDAKGRVLLREKPLLSIQDLDLTDHLEAMADAGIQSFKIEGRLKDADYVKNVVTYARRKLDAVLARRSDFRPASLGHAKAAFAPDPGKTFQRGLSAYRVDGARRSIASPMHAGHLGERLGTVQSVRGDRVVLDAAPELHPGDGLTWVDATGESAGTLVNAVEGRQLFVQEASRLATGTVLFRNLDHAWLKTLRSAKVERRLPVRAVVEVTETRATLTLEDATGCLGRAQREGTFGPAQNAERNRTALAEALARLGDTPLQLEEWSLNEDRFLPVSVVNGLRRDAAEALIAARSVPRPRQQPRPVRPKGLEGRRLDLTWNITNAAARTFYEQAGATVTEHGAECQDDLTGRVVMTTRHCLRFELGWCEVHPNDQPLADLPEPEGELVLVNGTTRLRCHFDCATCRMKLIQA